MINIPLKIGATEYTTIEKYQVFGVNNEKIAECSLAPELQIDLGENALKNCKNPVKNVSVYKLIETFNLAAEYFCGTLSIGGCNLSFEQHIDLVSKSTGLTRKCAKEGEAVIYYYLKNIEAILKSQSPDSTLNAYEQGFYYKGKKKIGWIKEQDAVGVILPSNTPTVHTIWLMAAAMKYQVMLKPSFDNLFTPLRIIESLRKAGYPADNVCFLPMSHKNINRLLKSMPKSIVFGSRDVVEEYKRNFPYAKYYGPGCSKLLIDNKDDESPQTRIVNHAVDGIISYGGRGCVSLSAIVTLNNGKEYAYEIAKRLSKLEPYPLDSDLAVIPAVKDESLCQGISNLIQKMVNMGAANVTEEFYEHLYVCRNGVNYLLPTVMYMNHDHPMFGIELPFPFITITQVNDVGMGKRLLKNSLSVSVICKYKEIYNDLLFEPTISMLHYGLKTNVYNIDPEKPFEGYISDYLYTIKTI